MINHGSRYPSASRQDFHGLCWLLLAVLMLFPALSRAATLYVDKSGTVNATCSKALPCLHIAHAVNLSKKNGRIVVGPGIYRESIYINNGLDGPLDGLRLESTAGRHGTIVESPSGNTVIGIARPKVRIGRKGKGFTLRGATDELGFGIEFSNHMDRVRIEGNSLTGNDYGVFAQGDRIQIRHNLFVDNANDDLTCSCDKSIIRENTFVDSGIVAIFENGESNTVDRNLSVFGGGYMSVRGKRSKIVNNVVLDTDRWGLRVNDADGATIQGNILTDNASLGSNYSALYVDQDTFSKSPRVMGNLVVGSGNFGIVLEQLVNGRIDSNTVVQSDLMGIRLDSGVVNPTIRRNSTYFTDGSNPACGISNQSVVNVSYSKHFFAAGDQDCGSMTHIGGLPGKPGRLKVNRAKML